MVRLGQGPLRIVVRDCHLPARPTPISGDSPLIKTTEDCVSIVSLAILGCRCGGQSPARERMVLTCSMMREFSLRHCPPTTDIPVVTRCGEGCGQWPLLGDWGGGRGPILGDPSLGGVVGGCGLIQ